MNRPARTGGDATGQIPGVQALRDGFAAFKPQRRAGASDVDRTREHGIVRPSEAQIEPTGRRSINEPTSRVRVADNEASLGELASGWGDEPIPHRPSARPAPRPAPRDEVRRPAPTTDITFDEFDEFDGYGDEPDVWADVRPSAGARRWADRVGLSAVDPLIARVGALLLVTALLVPLALSMRGGSDEQVQLGDVTAAAALPEAASTGTTVPTGNPAVPITVLLASDQSTVGPSPVDPTAIDDVATAETLAAQRALDAPADTDVRVAATPSNESDDSSASGPEDTAHADSGDAADGASTAQDEAVVDTPAERVACGAEYTVVAGDSWYGIAAAAAVPPGELLAVNQAALESVLLPGDSICLPEGAETPAPPSTITPAATTTEAPATTAAPTTTDAPATTAAPTTTEAPATTAAATTTTDAPSDVEIVSTAEAQQIIREVWPDDLEEKALEVAFRESRWRPDADNGWCCVGLFQIYWTVHQNWLDDYGITTRNDLMDARKNATAAYALYQRAGGWGPWGG